MLLKWDSSQALTIVSPLEMLHWYCQALHVSWTNYLANEAFCAHWSTRYTVEL